MMTSESLRSRYVPLSQRNANRRFSLIPPRNPLDPVEIDVGDLRLRCGVLEFSDGFREAPVRFNSMAFADIPAGASNHPASSFNSGSPSSFAAYTER
ncbi:hypothetical protein MUK42_06253 [Musa troglodytarum]|uniref:Uncharacterized protein n=1 Tax=Musa troglodytarum TaxID=320322 RepID=A0A9E7KD57_9LILI|nr:hypothetical protein MUK42_06253 [Musa troglodytarum]